MARKRRRFTADFKKRVALEALRERDPVQAIAARYEVHPNQMSAWKRQAVEGLDEVFTQPGSKRRGARGDDPGPSREDRRTDGGAGFFSARVGALSRPERAAMVDRGCGLPLSRQFDAA
ncbi:MAG: transposase [Gammaproteobacteria bacterium]|nr:transposase [Gammaproteobacteria bacterium]MDE0440914.1 transposase [Gammaproteobacteria bacterium]